MEEEDKGGGQEVRKCKVDGGNEVVQENNFKDNIKCRGNWDILPEEAILGGGGWLVDA